MKAALYRLALLGFVTGCSQGHDDPTPAVPPALEFEGVDWAQQSRIDRVGRPLLNLVFMDALATAAGFDHAKTLDGYNMGSPDAPDDFIEPIAGTLSLLDAADGTCGNQRGSGDQPAATRYVPLASMLADDRLYIGTDEDACNEFLGLELAELSATIGACGGRTPNDQTVDLLYTLAMGEGAESVATDGVDSTSLTLSDSPPFLLSED